MDTITYLRNENLKTIKPGYPGNKVINGQFANGDEVYHPTLWNVLRWKLGRNPQEEEKRNDTFRIEVKPIAPNTFLAKNDTIIWLGHASFFIRLAGISILADPILYDLPFLKRRTAVPVQPEAFTNIDLLLLSHGHRDHLDERSIQVIAENNPQLKVLAPLKMKELLHRIIPDVPVEEAGWFQKFSPEFTNPLEIFYLPARHWYRRGLSDINTVLWGSFLIRYGSRTIYFAGDTATGPHFREINELFGGPEFCLMPIGAYKPPFIMQQSHLDPVESVEAFQQLAGMKFVPMHFGTFDISDEPPGEPMRLLLDTLEATNLQHTLVTPRIGIEIPL